MGYVLLLSLVDDSRSPSLTDRLLNRSSKLEAYFRYPYRKNLAAKTVKQTELMPNFTRECRIWLTIQQDGIVPLLQVVDTGLPGVN